MSNPAREIKSYFYFTGEDIDGNTLFHETEKPITLLHAEFEAKKLLREVGGGHIDMWYSETDEFAGDVEV